jgi:hypothetical protein
MFILHLTVQRMTISYRNNEILYTDSGFLSRMLENLISFNRFSSTKSRTEYNPQHTNFTKHTSAVKSITIRETKCR